MIIAAIALAALTSLAPEIPISAPLLDAAAGNQSKPSLAWYGNSLATVWIDQRQFDPEARIAQLDNLGHPLGLAARASGPVGNARIASSGAATPLVAETNYGQTWIGPAGTFGRGVDGSLGDLVTDGRTYLLVTFRDNIEAQILDAAGHSTAVATFGANVRGDVVAVPFGGTYHVIYTQKDCGVTCAPAIHDTAVATDGEVFDQTVATDLVSPHIAAAALSDRRLIAWSTPYTIELVIFTRTRVLITHMSISGAQRIFAGSDGSEFLVGWTDANGLQAIRVDANGGIQGDAFTLGSANVDDLAFGRTPQSVVLAWSDGQPSNVFTRGATNFASIASAPTVLASIGYAQQEDVSLKGMAVWSEGETHSGIRSPAGEIVHAEAGHSLRHPVAARGAGSTLVAWIDTDPSGLARVMSKFDEGKPVVVGDGLGANVAFDGSSFFVVWSNGAIFKTRFTSGGAKLETTEIKSNGNVTAFAAARVGDKLAVAFNDGFNLNYDDGDGPRSIASTRAIDLQIATDDHDRPFIVWASDGGKECIVTANRVAGESFTVQPLLCGADPHLLSTAAAWSGTEFVVAWDSYDQSGYRYVHYMRTTRDGRPLDIAPLTVSPSFRDTYGPRLVPSPEGVTIGYQRVAGEEPFDDVSRVFTRTLVRLGDEKRERAVGH